MPKVPISFVLRVKNEAANLPRCLESISWADEVFVVDSQSTDGTQAVAERYGATVVQFHFNGVWPKKGNWALQTLPFRNEWIFLLDADEVLQPDAETELRAIAAQPDNPCGAYYINRQFMFIGRWLKHAYYPNWVIRLIKRGRGLFEQMTQTNSFSGDCEAHEPMVVQGEIGRLKTEMLHYAFPTIDAFVERHNRYSNWEARVAVENVGESKASKSERGRWRVLRKRIQKYAPFRPFLRFCYVYFWQRGFLDGREGYYFARLHAVYEFLSVAKTYEFKKQRRTEPKA